jgi:hypothetical protein
MPVTPPTLRSTAQQIADFVVDNYELMGPMSYKELAQFFRVSYYYAKQGKALADEALIAQGKVFTYSDRRNAWRMSVTNEQATYLASELPRLSAMQTELNRLYRHGHALEIADPDLDRMMEEAAMVLDGMASRVSEMVLANLAHRVSEGE